MRDTLNLALVVLVRATHCDGDVMKKYPKQDDFFYDEDCVDFSVKTDERA